MRSGQRLIVSSVALAVVGRAHAQENVRLSAPLVAPPYVAGTVDDAAVSADGEWAVYRASQDSLDVLDLYAVRLDGTVGPVRVSAPMPAGRQVSYFALAPAGDRVVYRADPAESGLDELFSAPLDGSAPPVKLNGPVERHHDVMPAFRIARDGSVVFVAASRLYSVPIDRSREPVELTGALPPSSYAYEHELTPDGRRVVLTVGDGSGRHALYSARADGGYSAGGRARARDGVDLVRLSWDFAAGALDVRAFRPSPDGRRVVFQTGSPSYDLYSVPVTGGPAVRLHAPLASGRRVWFRGFRIAPDSTRVLYHSDQDADEVYELFSVPIDASAAPVRVGGPLVAGGDVVNWAFEITPDSSRVVYLADQEVDGREELYAAPLAGGPAQKVSAPLRPGERLFNRDGFVLTPESRSVVYLAETSLVAERSYRLLLAPLDASAPPVRLNGAHAVTFDEDDDDPWIYRFRVAPDGAHVVYQTDEAQPGRFELFAAALEPAGGHKVRRGPRGGPVKLSTGGNVGDVHDPRASDFHVTPAGDVVFREVTPRLTSQLLARPVHGGAPARVLNGPLALSAQPGDVASFRVSPDSARVVYAADQEVDQIVELYSVPSDGSAPPVKLNVPLWLEGSVGAYAIAPDGGDVAYLARRAGATRVFGVRIDGTVPALELSGTLVPGGDVLYFAIAPEGRRVTFVADRETDGVRELFSVPIDGGPVVRLNDPLPAGGNVIGCTAADFTPDGTAVLYRADQEVVGRFELFVVPTDGGGPPRKLNGPLAPGGQVSCARVTPDGTRAVYTAAASVPYAYGVFSVPLDGSAPPVELSPPLVAGRSLTVVGLTPDGTRVVYAGDQEADDVFELYGVPVDGSAPPVKLNAPLVSRGDVQVFPTRISADGLRVVYLADQERNDRDELWSVPIDGSSPPVRLNAPLGNTRDVSSFELDPSGTRAVYLSDEAVDDVFEPWSVPIDGSQPPVRLHPAFPATGHIPAFHTGPAGRHVLFELRVWGAPTRLLRVPIAGGAEPLVVNGPLVAGGTVLPGAEAFAFTPDGARVLYLADQIVPGEVELFATTLGRDAVRSDPP